jgi:hypothetical protein
VESVSESVAVLAIKANGKEGKVTLTLMDGKFMNMKSTGTDDMDYYIWKHAL